jgi:glucuronate isomerase
VDANFLAGLVARHIVDMHDARQMARALAYDLVKETYRLADRPNDNRGGAKPARAGRGQEIGR